MIEPYYSLGNAIIIQAVNDYRKVIKYIKKHPDKDNANAYAYKKKIEKFFYSDWFSVLSKLNGAILLQKIQEEIINESKEGN